MFPWAFTLAFFSADILALWGRGSDVSLATALLPWLVAGTALNILVNPPCLVQMASGHTRAIAVMNGTAVVLFAPVLFALSLWSGAMGAALAWVLLNAGSFLIGVPALMRRTLPRELAHWYGIDIAIPAACALGVGLVARAVAFAGIPLVTALAVVLSVALGTLAAAAAAPATRPWLGHAARWVQARLA
jgi:O-antigen/teichoic acid export membrane protein